MCAQLNLNSPCADSPWAGGVVRFAQDKSTQRFEAKTNARGEFDVRLPAGKYSIVLEGPNPYDAGNYELIPVFDGPRELKVQLGGDVQLDFRVRTGIA